MRSKIILSAFLGLGVAIINASAPTQPLGYISGATFTNCPASVPVCTVWGSKISTINPYCCAEKESPDTCYSYSIEEWSCNAGGTGRYRNFKLETTLSPGNCDTDGSCY